jgi:thiamine transporter ThiT
VGVFPIVMNKRMGSKTLVFVAMMAALGNVLSFLSIQLAPIAPNIPLGPYSVSLAVDLSHLATFIAALFGGPLVGGATGLVGGIVAAFEFGFSKGNLVTGFGLPLGKALTGVTAGFVFKRLFRNGSVVNLVSSTVSSFIPEAMLTYVLFRYLLPPIMGVPESVGVAIFIPILIKALAEMVVLGVVLTGIVNNLGFKTYVHSYFS